MGKQAGGFYLLPTNQLLRPWGEQTVIPGRPVDMTFDSGQRILAVLNTRSILLLDGSTGTKLAEIPARTTSYAGIAFRPGDRELWASETTRNGPDCILITKINELGMPGRNPAHRSQRATRCRPESPSRPTARLAYVAFSRNNTLAIIDAATRSNCCAKINVGMAPFGVAVSAHGKVFVTQPRRPPPAADDTVGALQRVRAWSPIP